MSQRETGGSKLPFGIWILAHRLQHNEDRTALYRNLLNGGASCVRVVNQDHAWAAAPALKCRFGTRCSSSERLRGWTEKPVQEKRLSRSQPLRRDDASVA